MYQIDLWILCGYTSELGTSIAVCMATLFVWNEMELILKSGKWKRLLGLKVHQVEFKPVNSLEWRSAVGSVR